MAGREVSPIYDAKWGLVPKDPQANIEWRLRWWEATKGDRGLQRVFREAAYRDVLFWFNAFCWLYEPRPTPMVLPFCTWPHQDPAILAMDEHLGYRDLLIDKSRGEGATWMYLMIFLRRWLRDPMFSAGLVSRNMDVVDTREDSDSLMWKLDWELKMLPPWMSPKGFDPNQHRSFSKHTLKNPENEAMITGYAATGDVGAGGRKTVFAMDELARFPPGQDYAALDSTQHVTNSRFLVSTYKGDVGAYYESAQDPDSSVVKIVLDWKENPARNRHLYRFLQGIICPLEPFPEKLKQQTLKKLAKLTHRGFVVENRLRSPWYDDQCLRPGVTPRSIAQELDRDPHGSVSKVFNGEVLDRVKARFVQPPATEGRLVWDAESCEVKGIVEGDGGELKLWFKPGLDSKVPAGSYVVGCDVSAGTGGSYSSNSAAYAMNKFTGEQVAMFTSNKVRPTKFARLVVALAKWFDNAFLIWEANGPGVTFGNEVVEIGYDNIYYREVALEGLVHQKSQKPGFHRTNAEQLLNIFERLGMAMEEEAFIPRCQAFIDECRQYQWDNGQIVHAGAQRSDDDAAKGKAHGDRAIAGAMAWVGCGDQPVGGQESQEAEPPYGSMAWREWHQKHWKGGVNRDPWTGEGLDSFRGMGESGGELVGSDAWG